MSAGANEPVFISVTSETQQEFRGFGSNSESYPVEMPEETKRQLVAALWVDLDFRAMRFARVYHKWSIPYIIAMFEEGIRIKKEVYHEWHMKDSRWPDSSDLILLFNPTGTTDNNDAWTEDIVNIIDSLNERGILCRYTGVGNEPNQHEYFWAAPIRPTDFPNIITQLRRKLDERALATGKEKLADVKIIAPEPSNVDDYYWQSLDAITADEQTLNVLDGFAFHSYNMSIDEMTWRWIQPFGKELWQTESSHFTIDEQFNDSNIAAEMSAQFLADLNFGCQYWLYWIDYGPQGQPGAWNGYKIIAYNSATGEFKPMLKYYYMRQLSRTFPVGTIMRKCTTDLKLSTGRDVDKYMSYGYGKKIPLAACAGVGPDGHWGMAVSNMTDLRFTGWGASYFPRATYDVTFDIEELHGVDSLALRVWRSNDTYRNVFDDTAAVMRNGRVTVSVRHCELVSLRPQFDAEFIPIPEFSGVKSGTGSCGSCGSGIVLAFVPPAGMKLGAAYRRSRRKKRRHVFVS